MPAESPAFRIWLRRTSSPDRTFALRFEAFEGKGVLRVARPGVLVDPPARVSGYEADINGASVRASRFLHVSGALRRRETWFMSRLSDEQLEGLAPDTWAELSPTVDRGAHHLLLVPSTEEELVFTPLPEPVYIDDADEFQPHSAVEMIPPLPDQIEPVYAEELVPLEAEEAPDTDEDLISEEDSSTHGGAPADDEDEGVTSEGILAPGLAQIALAGPPSEATVVRAAPSVSAPTVAAPSVAAPSVAAPSVAAAVEPERKAAPPVDTRGPISPNGLVRHLRRQLVDAHAEIAALNARIAMLERKIAASELAPIALDADTDEA